MHDLLRHADKPLGRDFLLWMIIGLLAAVACQQWLDTRLGGPAAGLTVGTDSELRPTIEEQLGPIALWSGGGHDAQLFFQAALDPLSESEVGMSTDPDSRAYRYRRVLLPLLASGGFQWDGRLLLGGMAVLTALGSALALASAAAFSRAEGGRDALTASLILITPGWVISSMIFTSDALGAGLAFLGLVLSRRGREIPATLALGLAVAAKEQFLLVGLAVAIHSVIRSKYRSAAVLIAGPVVALATSTVYAQVVTGSGVTANGQLGLPGAGLAASMTRWPETGLNQPIGYIVLATMAAAIAVPVFKRRLDLLLHGSLWVILALLLDDAVWIVASNAARTLIAIPIIVAMAVGVPRRAAWSVASA